MMGFRRIKLSDVFGVSGPAALTEHMPAPSSPHASGVLPAGSILRTLNSLCRRLEDTLVGLREHANADIELRAIAAELVAAVCRAPDIAVAATLLNQIAGAYGVRHCLETAIVAQVVAQKMDKPGPELLLIVAAALTMNAGMVRQADQFHDRAGTLTDEERAQVRRHPRDSVNLLRWAGIDDEEWLGYVLLHHENADGSGYPDGRMGQEIAENASLIGAADRYCAMVSARNYRRSLLPPAALERLAGEVTAAMAAAFDGAIGAYPPGTLVRLQGGDIGVVAGRADPAGTLGVCTLAGPDGPAWAQPVHRLSTDAGGAIAQALHEDQARVRFTMQQVWGPLAAL